MKQWDRREQQGHLERRDWTISRVQKYQGVHRKPYSQGWGIQARQECNWYEQADVSFLLELCQGRSRREIFLFLYFQTDSLGSTCSPKHILFQWCGGDGRAVAEIRVDRGCREVRLWENWLWVALCSWIYVRRLFSLTTFPVLTLRDCEDVCRWLPFTK